MNQPKYIVGAVEDSKIYSINLENGDTIDSMQCDKNMWQPLQVSEELMAVSGDDNHITVWNLNEKSVVRTLQGHRESTRGLAFVPESGLLASGSLDHEARLWNFTTGECVATFTGQEGAVYTIDHIPSHSQWLFVASDDDTIRCWDMARKEVVHVYRDHSDDVDALCHDNEKGLLFSGSDDKMVKWFDVQNKTQVKELGRHSGNIRTICYRQAYYQLIVPCFSGEVYVYDIRNDGAELAKFQGHDSDHSIYGCCDVPNGEMFITSSWDEKIKAFGNDFKEKWAFSVGSDTRGVCPIFSNWNPDGAAVPVEEVDEDRAKFLVTEERPWMERFQVEIRPGSKKPIRSCRSFLAATPLLQDASFVAIDEDLQVSADQLLSLLAGDVTNVNPKHMLNYFSLFMKMDMKSYAYLICESLPTIKKTAVLVYLAALSLKQFEEPSSVAASAQKDELEALLGGTSDTPSETPRSGFKSAFTLAVFNTLKKRVKQITDNPRLAKACQRRNILGPLMTHEESPTATHATFDFESAAEAPASFPQVANDHLLELFRSRRATNVTLCVIPEASAEAEGPPEPIKMEAHLDVLCLKSGIFLPMLEDADVVKHLMEESTIVMKDFPSTQVALAGLIEFIYCGSIQSDDFRTLIPLWLYANSHTEQKLLDGVTARMTEVSRSLEKDKKLQLEVANIAHLLTDEGLVDAVAKMWSSAFNRDRLDVIRHTAMTKRLTTWVEEVETKFEERVSSLETRMKKVHETLEEILAAVQK